MTLKKKAPASRRTRTPTRNERRKVMSKLIAQTVNNRIVMGRDAAEYLEYAVAKDWRETLGDPEDILPLFREDASVLLSYATPIYLSIDGVECILRYTHNTGWVLLPGL